MSAIILRVQEILSGVRVLEMTEALAGPYCAMLLGDFGADVIKVERPGIGDQSRGWGPPFIGSESAYFLAANRNKRSLTLDYDGPRGHEALQKLLATADIFLVNQPILASLQKRGIDPKTLRAKFPRLIYCSITGYGFGGPKSGLPGYDIIAQAEAGVMSFTGEPKASPVRYPIAIADMTCGMYAAMGILAALFAREKTGLGQFLDMALFDSQLTWLANAGSNFLNAGVSPERWGNAHPSIVPYDVFRGSDARHFVVGVGTEPLWQRFVKLMGLEESAGIDERFRTNALRTKHRAALLPQLHQLFAARTAAEWLERLAAAEIPAAAINTVEEAVNDAQTKARGLIVQLEHPALGAVRSIANPIRFSDTPVSYRLPPPGLGEHSEDILRELGYSTGKIAAARNEGAV
jgi:crotonobetainyl-CoA:carnitine CoA-transferase CaiB-like acyl-CoA transferase